MMRMGCTIFFNLLFLETNTIFSSFSGIQLGIGFLMRKRPVFALATVATVVVKTKEILVLHENFDIVNRDI